MRRRDRAVCHQRRQRHRGGRRSPATWPHRQGAIDDPDPGRHPTLKAEIEADRDELSAQGVALDGVGIRTEGDGPRALIVAEPDDQMTREWLADTYGEDRIVVIGGEVVPQ